MILDLLLERQPHVEAAAALVAAGFSTGLVSADLLSAGLLSAAGLLLSSLDLAGVRVEERDELLLSLT